MTEDPRQAAERYRLDRELRAAGLEPEPDVAGSAGDTRSTPERGSTAAERAAFVETAIQQAIRRGEFDDLPGAGKPLPDLGSSHDPDWWIRRKIETEKLTGLGPPALTLRVEHAELAERLDAIPREPEVREAVQDFNRRVIEARRQLLGGPPVVTPTVDVDAEVAAWAERRRAREAAASVQAPVRRRRWFGRGR
ncbi:MULTISPECIES: DUF1992 domain-containing protein [Microbacterium]|uniref:DnaJ family domain-containing protein n=1 Tax=Microbacterium TaxID=33882 RepID=UPI002780AC64|nr:MULTISPECIES: DUF1992 domain-containing protein [Microbacterium]MDQ1085127.1 hypothetical protein [Microbacterium sp. SORGH_AS_0344]MDQ1169566.1 hypothetical protein [Microbacterium proteolyticum]